MSDKSRHITSNDGRHRVAYEAALQMWTNTNEGEYPRITDKEEFLTLVSEFTSALAYREG